VVESGLDEWPPRCVRGQPEAVSPGVAGEAPGDAARLMSLATTPSGMAEGGGCRWSSQRSGVGRSLSVGPHQQRPGAAGFSGLSPVASWISVLVQVSFSVSGVAAGMVVSEPWCRGRRARPGPAAGAAGADAPRPRLCSGVGQRGGRVPPTRHGGGAAAGHRPPSGAPGRSRRGCAPPAEPGRCWPRRRPRRVPGWRRRGGQSVAGAAMLRPAPPTFLPAVPTFGGIHQGQQCPDGVFVPDQDAVRAANLPGFRGDPNRRAAPIRASAVSGPGQCTSKAGERSGSVSEPRARNAARHTAAASHVLSATTGAGSPRTGRPRGSSNPVRRAKASPSVATCTTYRAPRRCYPTEGSTRTSQAQP